MDQTKLISIIRNYADGILLTYTAEQMPEEWYKQTHLPDYGLLRHLKWMCMEILSERIVGEKAHRWLGYIQGELRGLGLYSISDLREHSRGT